MRVFVRKVFNNTYNILSFTSLYPYPIDIQYEQAFTRKGGAYITGGTPLSACVALDRYEELV